MAIQELNKAEINLVSGGEGLDLGGLLGGLIGPNSLLGGLLGVITGILGGVLSLVTGLLGGVL
jgi:hypothetical protein